MVNKEDGDNPTPPMTPRERAKELLLAEPAEMPMLRTEDVQALIHELSVRQMELEIQNEELRQSQVELSHTRDRYADLYEFAPVGYLTLDKHGQIREANLTAATMLGFERQALVGANISDFVTGQTQDQCDLHRQAVFASETRHPCEIEMHTADGTPLVVRLESIAFGPEENRRCRTALIDITAARRAQQQLKESEERYRRLTEAVTDYVYRVRVEHGRAVETVHEANCEAVTGYTPEEFAVDPMLWITMVPPDDRALVERQVERILAGEEVPALEHRICRKDGQICWVLDTVSPQFDDQGRLMAYDGLLRDITERKEAEAALRELNQELERRVTEKTQEIWLLAEAVSHLGEGVMITDDELDWPGPRIRFVNEALCRITGYVGEELIGRSPRILQGGGSDRETLDRLKADLSAGRPCLVELVNYRKDGTAYDAELFITPLFDSEGRRTNFVSIHRDVTRRKQTEQALREREEQMRAVLNTAADAIITIDRRGIIEIVNPAAEKMFGYTPEELIGKNVKMLMPSPYRDEHDGYIARYLETGEARIIGTGREVVGQHRDGHLFPIDLAVSEIDHQRRFTGLIRDISERKALQGHLLTIAADEQRRIGQDLHDGVGQDLFALGMTAGTIVDSLANWPATEETASVLDMGRSVADGIQQCLRQVRSLSRGLTPVDVDSEGLASALSELARQISRLHGVDCRFVCPHSIHVDDSVTSTHLYRIAQEAVTNALKHGKAHSIHIALEERDGLIALQVADDGTGIPQPLTSHDGMGLRTMRYRAGMIGARLTVAGRKVGGTLVSCALSKKLLEPADSAERNGQ